MLSRHQEQPPVWFRDALQAVPTHYTVDVEHCAINCRAWGDSSLPALVFVHGGGAHSGWWDHVAPFFTDTHYVLAPDLSGHGDSLPRPHYALETWAREVLAVTAHANPSARPIIVGHSMGGWVASMAAILGRTDIDGVTIIDSPLRDRAPEAEALRRPPTKPSGYRTRADIVARFRAVPRQDSTLPYVADHIANESIRRRNLRWFWKFDPNVFHGEWLGAVVDQQASLDGIFDEISCRVSYLRCERGLVEPAMAQRIRQYLELRGPFVELPAAGHHPMLDQPLALVSALRTLLEVWSIT